MKAAAALVVLMLAAGSAAARPSPPDDLTTSHETLDDPARCNDCHVDIDTDITTSDAKCLGCHDHQLLAQRIAQQRGFHSSAVVAGKRCTSCHHEHRGKRYDLMGWTAIPGGRDRFDHDLTRWPLDGQHKLEACADCHKRKDRQGLVVSMAPGLARASLDKPVCGTCHNAKQPHKMVKPALLECERCHTTAAWKPYRIVNFSHDDRALARMPLLGSHKDVACTKCHPRAVFKLPFARPDACGNAGCHASPHDGHLFSLHECERCHSPTLGTLAKQQFDHNGETRFDLGGAHLKQRCYACHTKALGTARPSAACESCHAKDSHHQQRFVAFGEPPRCGTCHGTTEAWTPNRFEHGKRTKFPLAYRHADAPCRRCHTGTGPASFLDFKGNTSCMGCHVHQNVHERQFKDSQCVNAACHPHAGQMPLAVAIGATQIPKGTPAEKAHAIAGTFPLVKKHASVPCARCHNGRTQQGKTGFVEISPGCSDNHCHADVLHRGSLDKAGAPICAKCHSAGTWTTNAFDHSVETFPTGEPGFPLRGAHKDNTCEACHPKKQFAGTARTCAAAGCHADDDAHKGRLGKACERCHVETGDNTFDHQTMSAFRLDGKHLAVRCADCHPSVTFKPRPVDCFGCHPEPAVHKGQYGTLCEQCHTTRTWGSVKPLHDVGDFSLKGAHDNIACERCHRDSRPLAGSGNLCLNCHRQDDVHNNALSPRCGECHTQWSFAPARFDHTSVGCTLTGLHRTLACFDCHRSGNFAGLSPTCVGCHHDDAVRAANVPTNNGSGHPVQTQCGTCHNPNTWGGAPGNRFGRDSVCR